MRFFPAILFPIFVLNVLAQQEHPELGKLDELKGKSKIYIAAQDGTARDAIVKALGKKPVLTVVGKPDEAEFFLEYTTIARDTRTSLGMVSETGRLDAYYYRDGKKVVAWTKTHVGAGYRGDTPGDITKKFLKEWRKL